MALNHEGFITKKRKCTDILCLGIFIAAVVCWLGIGYYAIAYGDVGRQLAPTDSEGRKCGHDVEVVDRPNLFFFDLTSCTINGCDAPQVCISKCPTIDFIFDPNSSIEDLRAKVICKINIDLQDASKREIQTYIEEKKCASWYFQSKPLLHRCLPDLVKMNATVANTAIESLPYLTKILNDINTSWYTIVGMIVLSGFISLVYMCFLRFFATEVVTVSITVFGCLLCYAIYYSYKIYIVNSRVGMSLLIVFSVLLFLYVCIILFCWKKIYLACLLIKEVCRAVMNILSSFTVPLIPFVLQIVILVYAISTVLHLESMKVPKYHAVFGNDGCTCPERLQYTNNSQCIPYVFNTECTSNGQSCLESQCVLTKPISFIHYLHAYNVFGAIWLMFFVTTTAEMILSGTFVIWYWTFDKAIVPYFIVIKSVWRTIRYHLGTVALGSLLITVVRVIRIFLYTEEVRNRNFVIACILRVLRCIFKLVERFIKMINRNIYIICSIYGTSFFPSAKKAMHLIVNNIIQMVVLDKVSSWLLRLGRFVIIGLTVIIAYAYYNKSEVDIFYMAVPLTLIAVGSYLVTYVFFIVVSAAIDTILLCFLEDCERNDGSKAKPYFMSRTLRKVLYKSKEGENKY